MRDIGVMLTEFSLATGGDTKTFDEWLELRISLFEAEAQEWVDAMRAHDWLGVAKESGDVVYVLAGTAPRVGFDLHLAVEEVHDSNMSKVGPDGRFVERSDGKILKGESYREPDMLNAFILGGPLL